MKSFSKLPSAKARRERALSRAKKQLKDGVKPSKQSSVPELRNTEPLTDADKKRLEKEIATLESRI